MVIAKPFVKWIGGKRSIMDELLKRLPTKIDSYYEPFVGGGALFFNIRDRVKAQWHLSDLNIDLIVTYRMIQEQPKALQEVLEIHQKKHSKDYYYKMRGLQELSDPIENSARFIYLLKTCFNGLYRVNKNNEFNTPMGSYKNPAIYSKSNIWAVHQYLQGVKIGYQDFSNIQPQKGDFVYFDPPYHPTTQESFVNYVYNGFTEKDQTRLKDFALKLSANGVNVMISNSDTEFITDIYKKFNIQKIQAPRVVNCKANRRQSVYETIITNY